MAGKSKEEFINMAVRHFKAKRYEETIEACKMALALDRTYITAYYGIAKSFISLYQPYTALGIYNEALGIKETRELYAQRGDLYFALKKYADAANDYFRALELDPNYEKLKKKKAEANAIVNSIIDAQKRPTEDGLGYAYIYDDREEWEFDRDELLEEYDEYFEDWEIYTNQYK